MNNLTLIQMDYAQDQVPLAAAYLGGALNKEHIQFDLKLYPVYKNKENPSILSNFYAFLTKTKKIVAIGCWSDMLPYVIVALGRLKKRYPEKIIILGGIGPTIAAEEILNKFSFIDFIIRGCGVKPLPKLVKKIFNQSNVLYDDIERLVFRRNNIVISNPYGGYYLNVPDSPAYDLLGNPQKFFSFPVITSFGCPYQCTYCDTRPVSPKSVVFRPLNDVIHEIKSMIKIKHPQKLIVDILDEAFTIDKKRVFQFCNILKKEKLDISWICFGRVDTVDEDLLKVMAQFGCFNIFYGIESGSNRILKKIKKGFTIELAIEKLFLSKKYIKYVDAAFIFGFPFETEKDFRKTLVIRNALLQEGFRVPLFPLAPVKNTPLYMKYKKILKFSPRMRISYNLEIRHNEVNKVIKENPEIFASFYHYEFKQLKKIIHLYYKIRNRTFSVAPSVRDFLNQLS